VFSHCPGSRIFSEPVPEPIICPHCGKEVEIFTNEQSMRCYFCGGHVTRERRPSCFDWCRYADICKAHIESERRQK
jgi:DNA-directed RNA polymerase subunit RPC12/RpoP